MNRVIIDLNALRHNFQTIVGMMEKQGAAWSVVTKALCGHEDTLRALKLMGARSAADSRLDNLRAIRKVVPDMELWYLRLPHISVIPEVIELCDVSLNTEIEVIAAISREAVRQNKIHRIVIMIELGDLREGILPGSLIKFYRNVFNMPNIEVIGIGAQLGCMNGAIPNIDQISQLLLYRELLELKFQRKLPLISAGSSIFLPLLDKGAIPRGVSHYRIGEALFLGNDLIHGGLIEGLRDDVITLEAEIAEIKEKALVPTGETGNVTPFETVSAESDESYIPGERGYRALVTIGQLDTEVSGLTPLDPGHQIAGASSDITVVNLGKDQAGLRIGDTIRFRTAYAAFVRLMNDPYIPKVVTPPLDEFASVLSSPRSITVPPIMMSMDTEPAPEPKAERAN